MSECNKAAGCLALHNAWIVFRHAPRHKPEAWISFLINSPTPEKHGGACFFHFYLFIFWWRRGGEKGFGEFLIRDLPFPHLLNTRPSLRKTKPVTLPHDTTAMLVYQTNPVGVELLSLTLSFVSIFSSIPMTATNTFISQTQFCGVSPLFFT